MKYKIGDKVKYAGGDWHIYGTVNAAYEHSICPCYRIDAERMEKKCNFSITQFEFELDACNGDVDSPKPSKPSNPSIPSKPKTDVAAEHSTAALTQEPKPKKVKAWDINFEAYQKGEKSKVISAWVATNRKEYKTGKLKEIKKEKLLKINFPFKAVKSA